MQDKKYLFRLFHCNDKEWNSYEWQRSHSVRTVKGAQALFVNISEAEIRAIKQHLLHYRFSIMPYMFRYLKLLENGYPDIADSLTRLFFPGAGFHISQSAASYVAGEPKNWDRDSDFPLKHLGFMMLQHKYPDRALLRLSGCLGLCLYCFEAWRVLDKSTDLRSWLNEWEATLNYLRKHKEVKEVILSGGDPFARTDGDLEKILGDLRSIKHIDRVRFNSAVFMHCPMRITPKLAAIFKKFRVNEIGVHILHPRQITEEFKRAFEIFGDGGCGIIQMRSQIPFLKDINDSKEIFVELCNNLGNCGVSGYYLLHGLPWTLGSDYVRTPVWKMVQILAPMKRFVSNIILPEPVLVARTGKKLVPLKRELFWFDKEDVICQSVWATDEEDIPLYRFAIKEDGEKFQFDGDVDFLYAEYKDNPVIIFTNWLRAAGDPVWKNRWEMYLDKR